MTRILLLGALLLTSASLSAQSIPDWAAPSAPALADETFEAAPPPPPPPPPPVPIDGGLALLAMAGAGLAARKLRRS